MVTGDRIPNHMDNPTKSDIQNPMDDKCDSKDERSRPYDATEPEWPVWLQNSHKNAQKADKIIATWNSN